MSIRSLAKDLGISPTRVAQLAKKGMPTRSLAEAQSWRTQYIRPPTTAKSNVVALYEVAGGIDDDDLSSTLQRLRHVERSTATALEGLLRAGKIAEAAALRREHVAVIKAIYDAEIKSIKIAEIRGQLISVDRALAMINEAMQSAILVLRRLPEMGRDPAERARLEAFMNGVLAEIKTGAADGLKRTASAGGSGW
jgi:hypothetical protein